MPGSECGQPGGWVNGRGQRLVVDGTAYGVEDAALLARALPVEAAPGVCAFLREWFSDSPFMRLRTSGSTGAPKEFLARKDRMTRSARLTCDALGLKAGHSALVCMPLDFIAGKMMLVRALVAGLDLHVVPPCGHPLAHGACGDRHFDFSAMVPLQVYNCLKSSEEKERLQRIKTLLIGGGAIDPAVETELSSFPGAIYATYGMTETLSHIALRRVNGANTATGSGVEAGSTGWAHGSDRYVPFPTVALSLTDEGALVIDAPLVCEERLVTRDIAYIHPDGTFDIVGRLDNVINTGGIKVQIEEIEARLATFIRIPFAVTASPHEKYGEAVTLLLQGECAHDPLEETGDALPAHMRPKRVFTLETIPMTSSGKICRSECRELAAVLARQEKTSGS